MTENINSNNEINLYELLGVDMNSTNEEIKKAWKKMALKYHPDKVKFKTNLEMENSKNEFLKIKNAYDILSNTELKEEYDKKIKLKNKFNYIFSNGINIFDLNLKKYLQNFINSTQTEKIIELILHKKEPNIFFDISTGFSNNFNDFIEKITNIEIIVNFDLRDVWECNPKSICYYRYTSDKFEELIYPVDFIQIYEDEGEEIIINNLVYKGNLIVKINITNTFSNGENYFIFEDELYVLINNNRIFNNKFVLNFLDGNKYKFNIRKLKKITNKLGNVLVKKNFGLPKLELTNIRYSNLFFIIILY